MATDEVQLKIHDEIIPKNRDFIDNARTLLNLQVKAADVFLEWDRRDLAMQLRTEIEDALHLRRKMHLHIQAMETVSEGYTFDGDVFTDFAGQISHRVSQLQSRRFDFQAADEYLTYEQCMTRSVSRPATMRNEPEWQDDEVEFMEEGEITAPNANCPVSGKPLEELVHPVADPVGYVYERDALQKYISDFWREKDGEFMELEEGSVNCPVAGTNHVVTMEATKTCFALIRGLKRKRRNAAPSSMPDVI